MSLMCDTISVLNVVDGNAAEDPSDPDYNVEETELQVRGDFSNPF